MAVDIDGPLHELAIQIDRLRTLYEQYFIGIEKMAPLVARKDAEKRIAWLGSQAIGNTAQRFRYTTLLHKWKTYVERWDKVLREIENGTYEPHKARARKRYGDSYEPQKGNRAAASSPEKAGDKPGEKSAGEASAATMRSAAEPVAPSPIPGMSGDDLRVLHARYLEACRAIGDQRDVKLESLVNSLKKNLPEILRQNHCDEVDISVAVKGSKVILKASPKQKPPP